MTTVYRHKKRLGQHFLADKRTAEKIISACRFTADDVVVEIGPGQGAITALIAPLVKRLVCVETDRDLIDSLCSRFPQAEIVHADFLKWDFGSLPDGLKVVGNIPYYISSPIIEKLIDNRQKINTAYLTVQLEFGRRLAALPGGKDYGSLSCFVQYYAHVDMLFRIKNSCFKPAPKVDSCFISLNMGAQAQEIAVDERFLFKLIRTAFQQRRKTIVNALKGLVAQAKLERSLAVLGIEGKARPEELSLSNYIKLSKALML